MAKKTFEMAMKQLEQIVQELETVSYTHLTLPTTSP